MYPPPLCTPSFFQRIVHPVFWLTVTTRVHFPLTFGSFTMYSYRIHSLSIVVGASVCVPLTFHTPCIFLYVTICQPWLSPYPCLSELTMKVQGGRPTGQWSTISQNGNFVSFFVCSVHTHFSPPHFCVFPLLCLGNRVHVEGFTCLRATSQNVIDQF